MAVGYDNFDDKIAQQRRVIEDYNKAIDLLSDGCNGIGQAWDKKRGMVPKRPTALLMIQRGREEAKLQRWLVDVL